MKTLMLSALSLLVVPTIGSAQDAEGPNNPPAKANAGRTEDIAKVKQMVAQMMELQFEVQSRAIRCRMAKLNVEASKLAEVQLALRVKHARKRGETEEAELLELEQQQLALRTESCRLEVDLATLELERAKAAHERLKSPPADTSSIKRPVQIEYIDELGMIILRGAKEDVKKLQKVIEKIEQ